MSELIVMVEIMGGLGNQMFQYATARAVAAKLGTEPVLDLRPFEYDVNSTIRKYELDRFRISGRIATASDYALLGRASYSKNRFLRKIQRTLDRRIFASGVVYREKFGAYVFDPEVFDLKAPALLSGYWQSEKYFKLMRAELLKEFGLRAPLSPEPEALLLKIRASARPISVHIRRGDYVSSSKTARFHGQCSPRYYADATDRMRTSFPDAHFFVFSDDIPWCRSHFKAGASPVTFMDADCPDKSLADLMLMKSCAHHIIANSSFSWWGAWLCTRPGQVVMAPAQWVADSATKVEDVVPEAWVRIKS